MNVAAPGQSHGTLKIPLAVRILTLSRNREGAVVGGYRTGAARYDESVKIVKIMWVPVLLALLYSGWVIWRRNQPFERPQAPARPDPYGTVLKIQGFYAENGALAHGEKTLLCYGVVNATTVKIDPPVGDVWPSLSRCIEIAPAKTTQYTLTAGDGKQTISQSVEVMVK